MRHLIAALVLLLVAAFGVSGCSGTSQSPRATAPTTASASRQTVLPFTGLETPGDLAVDAAGNVYVTDTHRVKVDNGFPNVTARVIKLPAGSNAQTVLPQFVQSQLTTDPAGAVWVIDTGNEKLVKLAAGTDTQTVLPLPQPDPSLRGGVLAIDAAGNAYGLYGGGVFPGGGCCVPIQVMKSEVGSRAPTLLPFTNILFADEVAVDAAGNVYVGDRNRVLKLAPGADTQTVLPLKLNTAMSGPGPHSVLTGMAVDSAGNVYVVDADQKQVLKLPAGADAPIVLPFTGLKEPVKVAVDAAGNVYVTDIDSHQVLKLAAA